MKKFILLLATLLSVRVALAQTATVQGYCVLGAAHAMTSGLPASNFQQGVIQECLVTVYLTGTTNLATIYADKNNTSLPNPFTANVNGSWLFYAATGQGYDVVASGGIAPNVYSSPTTILVDVFAGSGSGSSVFSLNGLSGILDLTSIANTITITPHGSTIDLESNGVQGSVDGTNTAVVISYLNGGSNYSSCSVVLSGGVCSTQPTFLCRGLGSPPTITADVVELSPGNCTIAPTATITGTGTGASMALALAQNAPTAPSGSNVAVPTPITGYGDVAESTNPFLDNAVLTFPILDNVFFALCSGSSLGSLFDTTSSGLYIYSGCGASVFIANGPSDSNAFQFGSSNNGNETIFGGNLAYEPYNNAYGFSAPNYEGETYQITGDTTIELNGGVPGSSYTGAGTCSLVGGIVITGTPDTCTASLVSGGINWALSGTATYSVLPSINWTGATGGTDAEAPGIVQPGQPVLTGSAFMDPTSTFHVGTESIPTSTVGLTEPATLPGDMLTVGPGIVSLPQIAPLTGGPNCLQISSSGRVTNTGAVCAIYPCTNTSTDPAAINALLAIGSVHVVLTGTCDINGSLVIQNYNWLDLSQATLVGGVTATATGMITDQASVSPVTTARTCTLTQTLASGSTPATVLLTACSPASFTAADYEQSMDCANALGTGTDLQSAISNYVSSSSVYLVPWTTSTISTGSYTCTETQRTHDFRITGGTVNHTTNSGSSNLVLRSFNHALIEGTTWIGSTGDWAGMITDADDVTFRDNIFQNNSDGLHWIGPLNHVRNDNAFCDSTGDDCNVFDTGENYSTSPIFGFAGNVNDAYADVHGSGGSRGVAIIAVAINPYPSGAQCIVPEITNVTAIVNGGPVFNGTLAGQVGYGGFIAPVQIGSGTLNGCTTAPSAVVGDNIWVIGPRGPTPIGQDVAIGGINHNGSGSLLAAHWGRITITNPADVNSNPVADVAEIPAAVAVESTASHYQIIDNLEVDAAAYAGTYPLVSSSGSLGTNTITNFYSNDPKPGDFNFTGTTITNNYALYAASRIVSGTVSSSSGTVTTAHPFSTAFAATPVCTASAQSSSGAWYFSTLPSTTSSGIITYTTSGAQTFAVNCSGSLGVW